MLPQTPWTLKRMVLFLCRKLSLTVHKAFFLVIKNTIYTSKNGSFYMSKFVFYCPRSIHFGHCQKTQKTWKSRMNHNFNHHFFYQSTTNVCQQQNIRWTLIISTKQTQHARSFAARELKSSLERQSKCFFSELHLLRIISFTFCVSEKLII